MDCKQSDKNNSNCSRIYGLIMSIGYGWSQKIKLSAIYTLVAGDLTDLPVLLIWTGSQATSNLPLVMMDSNGPYPAVNGGADLRFSSDEYGNTELAFEIVSFVTDTNSASALAEIWVKLPSVSSASNTTFWMWWGNTGATAYGITDTYGRNNVWTDSYTSVHHFQESSGAPVDSVGARTSTIVATVTQGATGKLGKCYDFPQSGNVYLDTDTIGTGAFSVECWIQPDSYGEGTFGRIVSNETIASNNNTRVILYNNRSITFQNDAHTSRSAATNVFPVAFDGTVWYHIITTRSAAGAINHYIGGAQSGTANQADGAQEGTGTRVTRFGDRPATDRSFDGRIDEIRLLSRVVTLAETTTKYNNQNAPQTFVTFIGSQQARVLYANPIWISIPGAF